MPADSRPERNSPRLVCGPLAVSFTGGIQVVVGLPSGSSAITRGVTVAPGGPSSVTSMGVQQPTLKCPSKPTSTLRIEGCVCGASPSSAGAGSVPPETAANPRQTPNTTFRQPLPERRRFSIRRAARFDAGQGLKPDPLTNCDS